ncbi:MAG: SMP-30/gluconolactonase/LRE family protein [Anaerolineaceae bacterium]|nr:SMP-30/gluconolactonase/LRE family protein [Anaerolineaceae bacterium]
MSPTPELIANYACHTGENPLWNPLDKRVYWLDIPAGTIFRYNPATGAHEVFYRGDVMGGFTLQTDGSLLLFGVGGAVRRLHQGKVTTLIESLPGEAGNRFNDVMADPAGRVLCGTMFYGEGGHPGNLYLLEKDGTIRTLRENIQLSNGMGFSPDLKSLYHTDTFAGTITRFEYDVASGDIANPQVLVRLAFDRGLPDGLAVDAEGFVWSAMWDGARLVRYDPNGKIEREITFPVKKVSSLTFGGDDFSDMYVTTAGGDDLNKNGELAGALFRLRLGIGGKTEFLSACFI